MFLVVVNAHSKWPEVIPLSSTTISKTMKVLHDLFTRFGIPEQIVSNNGPQFASKEFQAFIKSNDIHHITSAPYHPAKSATQLAQLGERRSAERKVVSSNPGRTNTKGLEITEEKVLSL